MSLTALCRFGHLLIEDFFFLQVMPMALFPEATGFVVECQTSVGIMMYDNITHHQLFELAIDVQGRFSSHKDNYVEFCRLLSRILQNVPTEDNLMRVIWRQVLRMLERYNDLIRAAQSNKNFDRLWSPESNNDLCLQLEKPFQIDPPLVLT